MLLTTVYKTTKVPFKGYNNNIRNNMTFKLIIIIDEIFMFYCTQGDPIMYLNKQSQIENFLKIASNVLLSLNLNNMTNIFVQSFYMSIVNLSLFYLSCDERDKV